MKDPFRLRSCSYVAAVVNESGQVSTFGGVNDGVLIDPEHVAAADALVLVPLLPHVSGDLGAERTERKTKTQSNEAVVNNHTAGKHLEQPLRPAETLSCCRGIRQAQSALAGDGCCDVTLLVSPV